MVKTLSLDEFFRLRRLVFRGARPLDYAKWKLLFEGGSRDDYLSVLASYQNEDGGFGHNLECNNWNPDSSPYTVCIALDYLDAAEGPRSAVGDRIVAGVLRYLGSGAHRLEGGWVGMRGVPGNNDYAHMPWFHFDAAQAPYADVGVTKRLADFILRYAEPDSALRREAEGLTARYRDRGQTLLHGYPDYDPEALRIQDYDPATWPAWLPLPVYFIGSPESPWYPACRRAADMNLDAIVDRLLGVRDFPFLSPEEMEAYERSHPHPDGKRWCVPEQTVGNYYWNSQFIVRDLDILRKFGRLAFDLPVGMPTGAGPDGAEQIAG